MTSHSKHTLRPYQLDAIKEIQDFYSRGTKKVLLHLATGGGKTTVFCHILKSARERNKRALMVVRGRKLVKQASDRLTREEVPHGIIMSGHDFEPEKQIQVCSVDTLYSRQYKLEADLIVIDEAHLATSNSFLSIADDYEDAFFLPVTATPYQHKSLEHFASEIVAPITMMELISQGHLVDAEYYGGLKPDTKNVKLANGDYSVQELHEASAKSYIITDIAKKWKKFAQDRPTLCFAVNIAHSKQIAAELTSFGIKAIHIDGNDSDDIREYAFQQLEKGHIKVICNVGILSIGVDLPYVSAIILARPTQSVNLYLQQIGRGTRPFPNKDKFIILDHAGNVDRHGFMTSERPPNIEKKRFRRLKEPVVKFCHDCFIYFNTEECPKCGDKPEPQEQDREINKIDIPFGLIENGTKAIQDDFIKLKLIQRQKGFHFLWVYRKLVIIHGAAKVNKVLPAWASIANKYGKGQRSHNFTKKNSSRFRSTS